MFNAALVEAIRQLTTLILIIAMLLSPTSALAGVNPASENDLGSGNYTTGSGNNCSNDQTNSSSIDHQNSGGNSGSSDHSTSGQTNSNTETPSTLSSGNLETNLPGITDPCSFGVDSSSNDKDGISKEAGQACFFSTSYGEDGIQHEPVEDTAPGLNGGSEKAPDDETPCNTSEKTELSLSTEAAGNEVSVQGSGQDEETVSNKCSDQYEADQNQACNMDEPVSAAELTSCDTNPSSGGNSYIATVIPENGEAVRQGVETAFTVTFTELGDITKLGSAQLFIPSSLTVDTETDLEISGQWGYRWEDPAENSTFSKVLSLWALLEGDNSDYLGKNNSISATFRATASADQTHHFDTKAWQVAELDSEGKGVGVSSDPTKVNNFYGYNPGTGQYELEFSQPKVNVWVDQVESGYRTGSASGMQDLCPDEARSMKESNLHTGLDDLRDNLNWHYIQAGDLNMEYFLSEDGPGYNGGSGWDPVGTENRSFYGAFCGNGYEISGLKINRPSGDHIGLFGLLKGNSVLSSIDLKDAKVTGGQHVGLLAGSNQHGLIINCAAGGEVSATKNTAGGLVGYNYGGVIQDSSAFASVSGSDSVGGLVGRNYMRGLITGCFAGDAEGNLDITVSGANAVGGLVGTNQGVVTGSSSYLRTESNGADAQRIGGLVGFVDSFGLVENSFSGGEVFAPNAQLVGGLIGENASSRARGIYSCHSTATVTGGQLVGGLIGSSSGIVQKCYATGDVTSNVSGNLKAGGLVGVNFYGGEIKYSYASGDVSAAKGFRIGGLVGENDLTSIIENSYATGNVVGDRAVGGLVGYNQSVIKNTFSIGPVKGDMAYGGLVGFNSNGNILNSFFLNTETNNGFGIPKPGEEMLDIDTYTGWSIVCLSAEEPGDNIWYIDSGEDYPILWWQHEQHCDDNNGGNGGEVPPEDGQNGGVENGNGDKPADDDRQDNTPGGSGNNRILLPGMGGYSPGNFLPVRHNNLLNSLANHGETDTINQYLLVLISPGVDIETEALLTPCFITEAGWEEYFKILSALENLLAFFEAGENNFSAADYGALRIDIAVSYAAIKTVEARLLNLESAYEEAAQAYEAALLTLDEYGTSLSEFQVNLATEILTTIDHFLPERF